MSDYDSNYNSIRCPFCKELIISQALVRERDTEIGEMGDEENGFYQCFQCEKYFRIDLYIYKEFS